MELCQSKPKSLKSSLRRLGVTGCLRRLHARGNDVPAIVVAAETVPHVIGGSFFVKGRNCALDVCWEGAKDLDDLHSLVSSRGRDSHVQNCVDAQEGLGTLPPRPQSAIVGYCYNCYTSCRKTRMLERFIMENLFTATNTFPL